MRVVFTTVSGLAPAKSRSTCEVCPPVTRVVVVCVGSPVKNARGEDLGRIEDFVVDLGTGEVREALLRFNGALYGFPLTAFRPIVGNERLLLTVDRASLLKEQGLHGRQPLPEGQAFVSELIRGPVVDLVPNFSSRQVRAALLDNGKGVPLSALGPVP